MHAHLHFVADCIIDTHAHAAAEIPLNPEADVEIGNPAKQSQLACARSLRSPLEFGRSTH